MSIQLEQVIDIVRAASALMVREGFSVQNKGSHENIVTSSDVAVQHFLTERLGALLPGSGFLCEEEDLSDTAHRDVWIIDPIDGTANYARGIENCCISVALVRNGSVSLGVVYSPWRDELYTAERGRGAFCNGRPIHVSGRSFADALIFTAMCTYRKEFARACSDIIYDVYMQCNDLRRTGSAAMELCLIASGQVELLFEMRLLPWDYAAASLILQEAGGFIAGFDGALPSLYAPSLVVAANNRANGLRLLDVIHAHLDKVPY